MAQRRDERATWGSPGWRADVRAWLRTLPEVDDAAAEIGLEPVQTSLWSSLWRVAVGSGTWWFKQNLLSQRHEGSVQSAVAEIASRWVDRPMATEPERGWLLTADGGVTCYAAAGQDARQVPIEDIGSLLADYASLQRASLDHRDRLTHAGLPVREPGGAGTRATAYADELAGYPTDDPRHLAADDLDRVLAAVGELDAAARTLTDGPVPLCFDHGDLFVGNVFRPRRSGDGFRFFDLAESVWAHPFGSPIMLAWELAFRWEIDAGDGGTDGGTDVTIDFSDPRLRAVLDGYLGCWVDLAPLAELRVLAEAALRIAALHRCGACLDKLAGSRPGDTTQDLAWMWRQPRSWLLDVTRTVRM